jgi:topoisomerase IA-like protein
MSEQKKRGPKPKHADLPKEIRDNINESNLPEAVVEAIKEVVAKEEEIVAEENKPKKLIGYHPITGAPVYI